MVCGRGGERSSRSVELTCYAETAIIKGRRPRGPNAQGTEKGPPQRVGPFDVYMEKAHTITGVGLPNVKSGGVLLSHTLPSAVPSALEGLASGFGMRPGVSPPL